MTRRRLLFSALLVPLLSAALLIALNWQEGAGPAARASPLVAGAHHRSGRGAHASHSKPLKMIWGPLTLPNGNSAMPTYKRLGVQVIEIQLDWASTAPTRPAEPTNPNDPAYQWPAALDHLLSAATENHIEVAIMVKGTPGWANGGRDPSWTPTDPSDYANFMQAASRRYSAVHYWMIWGEVTRQGNYNPMPENSPVGPRSYALLLQSAYEALKAVSAKNIVIGGMTWTVGLVNTPAFIKWLRLPDGKPPRLDYFGDNPYATRFPKLSLGVYSPGVRDISDIDTVEHELALAYRSSPGGTPKLWLSEFSISSDHPNRAFAFSVSRKAQAQWVTGAFKLIDSTSYVAGMGWYQLLDEAPPGPEALTNGLMTYNGQPKPAFYAYARAP